jgi:hypothetical protein
MRSTASIRLCAAAISAALLFSSAPVMAQTFEPIVRSVLTADLDVPAEMDAWKTEIGNVANGLAYIDWHIEHFMKSPFLSGILPNSAQPQSEDAACQLLRDKPDMKLSLGERVDGNDNHLLLDMQVDLSDLPDFTIIGCEPIIATGEEGIRIRGFFYFPEIKIRTANMNGMMPITVDAMRIPANTFER